MKKVALIYGGKSKEHEVSVLTAFSIAKEIDYHRYQLHLLYITEEGEFVKGAVLNEKPEMLVELHSSIQGKTFDLVRFLKEEVDLAFPVVHGPNGEDGTLQGMLEMFQVPYVGSGVLGSAAGMDKIIMKKICQTEKIPQCRYLSVTKKEIMKEDLVIIEKIESTIGFPCFIKPANLGSSVGISKASNKEELRKALSIAAEYDRRVIVEENIIGREIEIGVLGNEELTFSTIGEVETTANFYDFEAKYKNQNVTKLHIPAKLPVGVKERVRKLAEKTFKALDCSGIARIDFFYDEEKDLVLLNEINTMPGFTPFSMYPMLFKEVGVSYQELIEKLIELSFEER